MTKFVPQYQPVVKLKYILSVAKQMLSGWVGAGQTVLDFENAMTKVTEKKHNLSTTSGTMALYLAVAALELPKNKKIIFPSYTFLAGANVLKHLGYKIEFMDVNRKTMCLDPIEVAARLDAKNDVSAVVYVNHNGYCDLSLAAICHTRGVKVIEDSAQAIGMLPAGLYADVSIMSFSVPKLITTGQGGMVMTDHDHIATKIKQLRDHGDNWRQTKIHEHVGLNLKFNDILAAYGLAQVKNISKLLTIRRKIFDQYRKHIRLIDDNQPSTWMVIYETNNADKIIEALKSQNIQAVKYYRSIPSNPAFNIKKKFPNAEYIYDHYLYLPSSLNLKAKQINKICGIIKRVENDN
jgi:perosamine synthetase